MFTMEVWSHGVAVRVAVTETEPGVFMARALDCPHAEATASSANKAAEQAAARAAVIGYALDAA